MSKINFNKLGLKVNEAFEIVPYTNEKGEQYEIEVKQYLPQAKKADLITWILNYSIDEETNTFSPIRVETYYVLGIIKFYTNITFTDKQIEDAANTYDKLDSGVFMDVIFSAIPDKELDFLTSCIEETTKDISQYSNSAQALVKNMTQDATALDTQLNDILTKIKNKEGLEELSAIKDIV